MCCALYVFRHRQKAGRERSVAMRLLICNANKSKDDNE